MPVTIGGGLTFCGRELKPEELDVLRQITREFSTLSLTELAHTVCELLEWRRPNGGLKSRECYLFLLALHSRGWLPWLSPPPKNYARGPRCGMNSAMRRLRSLAPSAITFPSNFSCSTAARTAVCFGSISSATTISVTRCPTARNYAILSAPYNRPAQFWPACCSPALPGRSVSYTHLRAHETVLDLVCRLLLEKKNNSSQ